MLLWRTESEFSIFYTGFLLTKEFATMFGYPTNTKKANGTTNHIILWTTIISIRNTTIDWLIGNPKFCVRNRRLTIKDFADSVERSFPSIWRFASQILYVSLDIIAPCDTALALRLPKTGLSIRNQCFPSICLRATSGSPKSF